MMRFQKNRDTVWMQHSFQRICNLLTNPFLHGKALGKEAYEAGQFGNANDVFVRDITNICHTIKREGMMLAKRKEGNGTFDHLAQTTIRFAAAFSIKDAQ